MDHIATTNRFSETINTLKVAQKVTNEQPFGQKVSDAAHQKNQIDMDNNSTLTIKQQHNASILQASFEVNVSVGNESLALLYKAAITGINDSLSADFGDNAIQNAYDAGVDVSPEATADRIVSMSTGFFSSYRDQNPELSEGDAAKSFAKIIGGGIDTGFEDAKNILEGLQVLEGDIANNIDTTYELVQKGLQAFVESHSEEIT